MNAKIPHLSYFRFVFVMPQNILPTALSLFVLAIASFAQPAEMTSSRQEKETTFAAWTHEDGRPVLVADKKNGKDKKKDKKAAARSNARAGVNPSGDALIRTINGEGYWSCCLLDTKSNQTVYQEYANEKTYPGNAIALMVLLTAAEQIQNGVLKPDEPIILSQTAVNVPGSNDLILPAGTATTVREAMQLIALRPFVNLTAALAEKLYGTQEQAISAFNSRAKMLGMRNTVFLDFTGLDGRMTLDKKRNCAFTSAYDMAILGKALLQNKIVAALVKVKSTTTSLSVPQGGKPKSIRTANLLLRNDVPGCIGLWSTSVLSPHAGAYGIYAFERNGKQYVLSVWGSRTFETLRESGREIIDEKVPISQAPAAPAYF